MIDLNKRQTSLGQVVLADSHCHLYYDEIYSDLPGKISAARLAGVEHFLTVSTDNESISKNLEISKAYENVYCSVGIHPLSASESYFLSELETHLSHEKVVAIGEVGLDYHYNEKVPKAAQIRLFEDMLSMSAKSNLPYIFHARECYEDIFGIIRQHGIKSGVFHCFTDTLENAKRALDLGFYISFSGVITFKNSDNLREVAKYIPSNRILVETDCPYLAPVPFRGKPNEPAFVTHVARCLAQVRDIQLEELAEITTENFFSLFNKAKRDIID